MSKPQQSLVTQQNLWKTFLFSGALIATNILQNLSGTINTVFCRANAWCACHCCGVSIFPDFVLFDGFCDWTLAGATVLVGQAWGAQNT